MTYPIAFKTKTGQIYHKSKEDLSYDGTPRYVPNPNSSATYAIENLQDKEPIYFEDLYCGDISCNSGNSDSNCYRLRKSYAKRLINDKPETCFGCVYSKIELKKEA